MFTNTTLNTKVESVEKNIPNHGIYATTIELNKLTAESFAERLKQVKLATTNDLNAVKVHGVENEEKTGKLQTFDSSYFTRLFLIIISLFVVPYQYLLLMSKAKTFITISQHQY